MREQVRLATPEEADFYLRVLYPLQDRVLQQAAVYGENLYLTGGTALARIFFHHRYSDDLDFFTTTGDLKRIAADLIGRLQAIGLEVEVAQLDVYFARLFVVEAGHALKLDFVREPNLIGALQPGLAGGYVNTLEDIGANKVTAFEDRAEIKDIVDLYYITRTLPLDQLFVLAEQKRVPIAYATLLSIHTVGISGRALLAKPIDDADLGHFVEKLTTRAEVEVKKKVASLETQIDQLLDRLLWDFPGDARTVDAYSLPVLRRRVRHLPLPERLALEPILATATAALEQEAR
jgi:hypothetical protein